MYYAELQKAREMLTGPGGDFEITEREIMGNRILDYKNAPPSIREFWLSAAAFADRAYIVYEDERISYTEAHRQANAVAAWLYAYGLQPGDRIAIAMRNYPEWMLLYWACTSVGITVVGMNAWWTPTEMAYGMNDAKPKVLFTDAERLERVIGNAEIEQMPDLVGIRLPNSPDGVTRYEDVISTNWQMPVVQVDPDSDACIFYTSGTTGFPKGAQLTHRGCIANLLNMGFSSAATALAMHLATGDPLPEEAPIPVGLVTTPLFHVTANNCGAYLITAAGGTMVLMYRWDAGEALKIIEREKVTAMSGVPIMAREVINHPDFETTDTSSLTVLNGGGAQVPPDQVQMIEDKVETARPGTGYGMTETCGIITSVSSDFFLGKPDSAGPAMPNFQFKCVDDEGNEVPKGELGELWVRGSSVIKGYINRPDATAESITDGWLHTGDIARIDEDDFIYIMDRKKDMVLRGGENIYCAEVEAGIFHHPAVAEVVVFGVPDDRLGEDVATAIVLKPGATLSEEELKAHCAERMAKFKIPSRIWFCDEPFPRNASRKFLKREVRAKLLESA